MNLWPCVLRELQVSARLAGSYWLRVFCGAAALVVGVCTMASVGGSRPSAVGTILFGHVSGTLGAALAVLIPVLLSDSISRERREGTLPLLLLTPLRPFELTLAKSLAGMLRGLTIILAILPLLAVGFLFGGLTAADLLRAGLNHFSILFCGVAVGIAASTVTVERRTGVVLALGLMLVVATVSGPVQWYPLHHEWMPFRISNWREAGMILLIPMVGWASATGIGDVWNMGGRGAGPAALRLAAMLTGVSMLFLFAVAGFAGRRIAREGSFVARSGVPGGKRFWGWPRWLLRSSNLSREALPRPDRNPTGWLHTRRKSTRIGRRVWVVLVIGSLVFFGLAHFQSRRLFQAMDAIPVEVPLAFAVAAYGFTCVWLLRHARTEPMVSNGVGGRVGRWLAGLGLILLGFGCSEGDDLSVTSIVLGLLTLLGLVINSSLSWREERETGAVELLAVTPLSTFAILAGRWRALVAHYLPAFGLLFAAFWVGFFAEERPWANGHIGDDEWHWAIFLNLGAFSAWAMVPLVGMYASLRLRSSLAAMLLTVLAGVLAPWLATPVVGAVESLVREAMSREAWFLPDFTRWPELTLLRICGLTGLALQLTVGGLAAWLCHRGMERRTLARS